MSDLPTPDSCELAFHDALAAGDAAGVKAALRDLDAVNPDRAKELFALLEMTRDAARTDNEQEVAR